MNSQLSALPLPTKSLCGPLRMQTAQQLWLHVNGAIAVTRLLAHLDAELEGSADWDETDEKLLKKILVCRLDSNSRPYHTCKDWRVQSELDHMNLQYCCSADY